MSSGGKSVMDADPAPPAYYEALLMGALIVNADWAQKCSESGSLVEETNYQVRGRSLSTYAVGGEGVMKMQTEAYRGGGGSAKCVHTQLMIKSSFHSK